MALLMERSDENEIASVSPEDVLVSGRLCLGLRGCVDGVLQIK